MNSKTRRRVGLLVETSRAYGRELLRGVALFARTRTDWSLLHQEMSLDSGMPDWMRSSVLSGVIARVDTHTVDPLRRLHVPIVDVRCNHKFPDIPQVDTDNPRVAELAFQHLWERGFRRFAFCGFRHASYSDARLRTLRDLVKNADCPLSVYETRGTPGSTLTGIEQSGMVELEPMSQWLSSLAHPTGLFVCNDIRGQQVLNVCRTLQLAVPDDIGFIGVDDDEAICLLSDPPLSSVRPDAERVGYRAAEILHGMIAGVPAPRDTECVPPTSVVQRLSTQVVAVDDRELARVCRFIILGPRCRALITTRDASLLTSVGGTQHLVELLTDDEALRLLALAVGRELDELPAETRMVIKQCGRLPLAVSLAGGMAAAGMSWTNLLTAFDRHKLEFFKDPHRPEQHQSLWKMIEMSVRALDAAQQIRLVEFCRRQSA